MNLKVKPTTNVLLAYQSDCISSQKIENFKSGEFANLIFELKIKSKAGFFANTELRKKQIEKDLVVFKMILTSLGLAKAARNNIENVAKDIVKKINEFCAIFEGLKKNEKTCNYFDFDKTNKSVLEFVSQKNNIIKMIPSCIGLVVDKDFQDRTAKVLLQYEKCSLALSCVLRIYDKCELLKKLPEDRASKTIREIRREMVDFVKITDVIKNWSLHDFNMEDVVFENKQINIYAALIKGI